MPSHAGPPAVAMDPLTLSYMVIRIRLLSQGSACLDAPGRLLMAMDLLEGGDLSKNEICQPVTQ